jgi:hypothetical protein
MMQSLRQMLVEKPDIGVSLSTVPIRSAPEKSSDRMSKTAGQRAVPIDDRTSVPGLWHLPVGQLSGGEIHEH